VIQIEMEQDGRGTDPGAHSFFPDAIEAQHSLVKELMARVEDYFQLAGRSALEKAVRFLVGLAPALLHRHYLADRSRVDLRTKKGPSTVIACELCAGIAASEVLKILLGRGKVWAAPHGIQFDGYRNKLAHTWRPGGNRNPINRLAIAIAKNQLGI
ncbi:MAG TPA: hypothetical protein VHP83_24980, partial [Aggregatilineaceae bacterium]|nr:hypothetical protein [Aggregatilineaceae bacterium]